MKNMRSPQITKEMFRAVLRKLSAFYAVKEALNGEFMMGIVKDPYFSL